MAGLVPAIHAPHAPQRRCFSWIPEPGSGMTVTGVPTLALHDQRVDDGQAFALGMDDDRVQIDLGDLVGVLGRKL